MAKNYQGSSENETRIKFCPLCSVPGSGQNSNHLTLRQINAKEAIYVCNNPECFYPVGEEVQIIQRKVPELLDEEAQDETITSTHLIPLKEKEQDCQYSLPSDLMPQPQPECFYDSLLDPDIFDFLESMTN